MATLAIETDNLSKSYGQQVALEQASIQVKAGEIYGLVGRNGAGKTTLLKILSRQIQATSGSYTFFNERVESRAHDLRLGMMIEGPGLYPHLSARDNLMLKCEAMGIRRLGYVQELLELVGLGQVKQKKAKSFSLGMKQRLSLALALVGDPDILLLDEPTNGLDPQGIADFRKLIQRLNQERGLTIMISSHILSELAKMIDKIGIIHQGILVKEVSKQELEKENRNKYVLRSHDLRTVLAYLEENLNLKDFLVVDDHTLYIYEYLDQAEKIPHSLIRAGILFESFAYLENSLEDYYMQLTGGGNDA
ncbi:MULTISPECIES: ABC transporter ATP-binding protein [Aerococcus]|uniref:ABC transporter ATP-binding protein n=1 Tax=Aerococcus TaxID=1375 RepID=UPI000DCB5484|nr:MULTISPECIES: ABC transporter ATP-binding protein [Aerococcus]KAA9234343.1 ABC transporter ATP-binding protein [Aerococcus mictus]MBU5610381.1 ABC transporter ATP-binding protein [Aerococcus urinae]MDK6291531.1 ABC transporter ATP-binding protein [Aerococcus urinae]MDK6374569.1 ABC transporter ATP-binding protein [Aerococcus urinae]MDK6420874.1 ABC transporter ATP-binding protein [Aerococcus urinae]